MKKQHLIIFTCIMVISLIAGIYQYIQVFQTELVGAFDTDKKANGHSWSEMPCTAGLCVTVDNKVGIGTESVSATDKLSVSGNVLVDGKISVLKETTINDPSNVLVSKGFLSSFTSPNLKIISGTGVSCPEGTDTLMKCIGSPICTWNDSGQLGVPVRVMCGESLTIDGSPLLINGQHTEKQCQDAVDYRGNHGSIVAYDAMKNQCQFGTDEAPIDSCPSQWGKTGWGATAMGLECPGSDGSFACGPSCPPCVCPGSGCSYDKMIWQFGNSPSCWWSAGYYAGPGLNGGCKATPYICAAQPLSQIGCY